MESLIKLSKDLKEAVETLDSTQARYLVDTYYQQQDYRIQSQGQIRAIEQGADESGDNPHAVLDWLHAQNFFIENQLKLALGRYAKAQPIGKWLLNQKGIGPVIAAGLISHIDINKAPTCGHIWNFAGLNPGIKWEKKTKRPWNAKLKTLCFKLGESFVKQQGKEAAIYADYFGQRKALEIQKNDRGEYAEHAGEKSYAKSTEAWAWVNGCYPAGICQRIAPLDLKGRAKLLKEEKLNPGAGQAMLPPAHVHAIARRWVVKLFLSHLHQVWFRLEFGKEAPKPYAIDILGHGHMIDPPA